jgi:hypothetical protein
MRSILTSHVQPHAQHPRIWWCALHNREQWRIPQAVAYWAVIPSVRKALNHSPRRFDGDPSPFELQHVPASAIPCMKSHRLYEIVVMEDLGVKA